MRCLAPSLPVAKRLSATCGNLSLTGFPLHLLCSLSLVLVSDFLWSLGLVWMEFVLGWGFFLVLFSGLDFDDLGFFGNPQFPLFPTVFGFRTSLLAHTFPLCHGVGPNVFGASLPHARHGV